MGESTVGNPLKSPESPSAQPWHSTCTQRRQMKSTLSCVRVAVSRGLCLSALLMSVAGCDGNISTPKSPGNPFSPDTEDPNVIPEGERWRPLEACEPVLPQRVTRLSDTHLSNAIGDLLQVAKPVIQTGALDEKSFLPATPATITGSVAVKFQDVAEKAAAEATMPGKAAVACSGDTLLCAGNFIDNFAVRAFRRALTAEERTALLATYTAGRNFEGKHADGISLVIEAVLQSPSFVYFAELGVKGSDGKFRLSGPELAMKLSLFLRNTVPDAALMRAATEGKLDDEAGLAAEVDRLLAVPAVQANLDQALSRFFGIEGLAEVEKAPSLPAFTAQLAQSMYSEVTKLINDVVWHRTGTLQELLTTRDAQADPALAALYGVAHPSGSGVAKVTLPESERSGILTRAGLMAMKASPDETSTIFRGLMVTRGLMCSLTPLPDPAFVARDDTLTPTSPVERGRAEARMASNDCRACHRQFEPFGITFEHYDAIGQYRNTIATPSGPYPVDASWSFNFLDIKGSVANAVELSTQLSQSRAVRQCMTQNFAAYAMGERLANPDWCTTGALYQRFENSGGNLKALVRDIALWPGLRIRKETL